MKNPISHSSSLVIVILFLIGVLVYFSTISASSCISNLYFSATDIGILHFFFHVFISLFIISVIFIYFVSCASIVIFDGIAILVPIFISLANIGIGFPSSFLVNSE